MRGRKRTPRKRLAVRWAATTALIAAVTVPIARRRMRIPGAVVTMSVASAPLALAVVRPRTKGRDVAIFVLQMWAFMVVHELPYDDPGKARRRLRIRYPIALDRLIGGGVPPTLRLQRAMSPRERVTGMDRAMAWVHWLWFCEPYLALVWVLFRRNEQFPRAATRMAAVFDLGAVCYSAVPTAPPWWAGDNGYMGGEVRRVMVEAGEEFWGPAWDSMYGFFGGNPWAAMPSLHFATSVMAAVILTEAGPVEGAIGWGYALSLGFALVYLGEHYVSDLIGGLALVEAIRRGEPRAQPAIRQLNRGLQRLERMAK